ncbi:hypothetical protein BH09ACT7_BH09ACT7_53320 [soil metagenome]
MRNVMANDAHRQYFGITPADLRGRHISEMLSPSDYAVARPRIEAALHGVEQSFPPTPAMRPGALRYIQLWIQRNAVLVPRGRGAEDVVVAQFQDIGSRRHAEVELARMVDADALTGLNNRHALVSLMDSGPEENLDRSLGVIFIDIDGFKDINDAHGHAAGDEVLVQFGQRLAALLTRTMTAYRLGGDDFVVLDPNRSTSGHTADFRAISVRL